MRFADNIDLGSAVLGGVIIGISTTCFLMISGKLTGISGFVENSISPAVKFDEKLWSWSYLIGLMLAGTIASLVDRERLGIVSEVRYSTLVGALFVGFGTRMGCGCTSGHGISGLPRGSLRALVAVCTFMAAAMVSAVCTRLMTDSGVFPRIDKTMDLPYWSPIYVAIFIPLMSFVFISGVLFVFHTYIKETVVPISAATASSKLWIRESKLQHALTSFVAGFVCGVGLAISGMCDPLKVTQFLDFTGPDGWDPSLAGVMGGGVVFNAITFHLLHKHEVETVIPSDEGDQISLRNELNMWKNPANLSLPRSFVVGAALFGVGWGMCGVCPGPGVVNLGAASPVSAAYLPLLLLGMACHEMYKSLDDLKKKFRNDDSVVNDKRLLG